MKPPLPYGMKPPSPYGLMTSSENTIEPRMIGTDKLTTLLSSPSVFSGYSVTGEKVDSNRLKQFPSSRLISNPQLDQLKNFPSTERNNANKQVSNPYMAMVFSKSTKHLVKRSRRVLGEDLSRLFLSYTDQYLDRTIDVTELFGRLMPMMDDQRKLSLLGDLRVLIGSEDVTLYDDLVSRPNVVELDDWEIYRNSVDQIFDEIPSDEVYNGRENKNHYARWIPLDTTNYSIDPSDSYYSKPKIRNRNGNTSGNESVRSNKNTFHLKPTVRPSIKLISSDSRGRGYSSSNLLEQQQHPINPRSLLSPSERTKLKKKEFNFKDLPVRPKKRNYSLNRVTSDKNSKDIGNATKYRNNINSIFDNNNNNNNYNNNNNNNNSSNKDRTTRNRNNSSDTKYDVIRDGNRIPVRNNRKFPEVSKKILVDTATDSCSFMDEYPNSTSSPLKTESTMNKSVGTESKPEEDYRLVSNQQYTYHAEIKIKPNNNNTNGNNRSTSSFESPQKLAKQFDDLVPYEDDRKRKLTRLNGSWNNVNLSNFEKVDMDEPIRTIGGKRKETRLNGSWNNFNFSNFEKVDMDDNEPIRTIGGNINSTFDVYRISNRKELDEKLKSIEDNISTYLDLNTDKRFDNEMVSRNKSHENIVPNAAIINGEGSKFAHELNSPTEHFKNNNISNDYSNKRFSSSIRMTRDGRNSIDTREAKEEEEQTNLMLTSSKYFDNKLRYPRLTNEYESKKYENSITSFIDQQSINKQSISKQSMNQQSIDQQLINQQQPLNQQSINQKSLNQKSINQQPIHQQQSINQKSINQKSINQQPIHQQQSINQQSINQQSINQQPIHQQQSINQQSMNQKSINQQPIHQQQSINQQSINQKSINHHQLPQSITNKPHENKNPLLNPQPKEPVNENGNQLRISPIIEGPVESLRKVMRASRSKSILDLYRLPDKSLYNPPATNNRNNNNNNNNNNNDKNNHNNNNDKNNYNNINNNNNNKNNNNNNNNHDKNNNINNNNNNNTLNGTFILAAKNPKLDSIDRNIENTKDTSSENAPMNRETNSDRLNNRPDGKNYVAEDYIVGEKLLLHNADEQFIENESNLGKTILDLNRNESVANANNLNPHNKNEKKLRFVDEARINSKINLKTDEDAIIESIELAFPVSNKKDDRIIYDSIEKSSSFINPTISELKLSNSAKMDDRIIYDSVENRSNINNNRTMPELKVVSNSVIQFNGFDHTNPLDKNGRDGSSGGGNNNRRMEKDGETWKRFNKNWFLRKSDSFKREIKKRNGKFEKPNTNNNNSIADYLLTNGQGEYTETEHYPLLETDIKNFVGPEKLARRKDLTTKQLLYESLQRNLANNPDEEDKEVRIVEIDVLKSRPLLGLAIEGGSNTDKPLPRVAKIQRHGSAYDSGALRIGDLLLEVDGLTLVGRDHLDCAKLIADAFKTSLGPYLKLTVVRAEGAKRTTDTGN